MRWRLHLRHKPPQCEHMIEDSRRCTRGADNGNNVCWQHRPEEIVRRDCAATHAGEKLREDMKAYDISQANLELASWIKYKVGNVEFAEQLENYARQFERAGRGWKRPCTNELYGTFRNSIRCRLCEKPRKYIKRWGDLCNQCEASKSSGLWSFEDESLLVWKGDE